VGRKERHEEGVDFVEATCSGQAAEMGSRYGVLGFGLNDDRPPAAAIAVGVWRRSTLAGAVVAQSILVTLDVVVFLKHEESETQNGSAHWSLVGWRDIGLLQCHF
jgi:hypothetical protein